jgi:hypothetical protein
MKIFAASSKVQGVVDIIKRLKDPEDNLGREVKSAAHLAIIRRR